MATHKRQASQVSVSRQRMLARFPDPGSQLTLPIFTERDAPPRPKGYRKHYRGPLTDGEVLARAYWATVDVARRFGHSEPSPADYGLREKPRRPHGA